MAVFKVKEECCFINIKEKGQYLYTHSFYPVSDNLKTGIIIIPPICRERLRAYREMIILARALAVAGYSVICFDYRGEGESFGDFKDFNIDTRIEDIQAVVDTIRKDTGIFFCLFIGNTFWGYLIYYGGG